MVGQGWETLSKSVLPLACWICSLPFFVANGGTEIGSERYWSSSEYDADYAWKQALYDNGGQYSYWKPTYPDRVRAVREF